MATFLSWLNQNQWLNLVFLTLAVCSIIISIVLYRRNQKEKIPVYHMRHFSLLRKQIQSIKKLKILYEEKELDKLTLTRVALWNNGRDTINHSDLAPSDPLRIQMNEDCFITQANYLSIIQEAVPM